jgi:hypothetical protein
MRRLSIEEKTLGLTLRDVRAVRSRGDYMIAKEPKTTNGEM